jgi:hypothetical protein
VKLAGLGRLSSGPGLSAYPTLSLGCSPQSSLLCVAIVGSFFVSAGPIGSLTCLTLLGLQVNKPGSCTVSPSRTAGRKLRMLLHRPTSWPLSPFCAIYPLDKATQYTNEASKPHVHHAFVSATGAPHSTSPKNVDHVNTGSPRSKLKV